MDSDIENYLEEKYHDLELRYQAMRLIALSASGIPLDILQNMEPTDPNWGKIRSEIANDFMEVLNKAEQEINQRIVENTEDTCWEEACISASSDYAAALE
ncbi:MAG: hypothetical protein WC856_07775 [Methylococcaceae bacterium]|jgi:hypothetical protein